MNRPRLLDLFSGAGGSAMGYHRAGFDVTGVDNRPQPHYPFPFVQADALEYLRECGHCFDAIHASPPCQFAAAVGTVHRSKHENLIPQTRELLIASGKPFVIENVPDARFHLRDSIVLCGTMFGLRVFRHRYFEVPWLDCTLLPSCNHTFVPVLITGTTRRKSGRKENTVQECRDASGIDWMTRTDLDQAIPPAYTEWIGLQMREAIR